ncbi:NAD/NADP octopine/nopaline dehydrogenase [Rhypophila decipiens]|uniref:NAD/NADP octopine/nopaline dehydrogenase n=1 Tax=Rhypophila decipiens TaxID=261697 RepID=A0AAN7B264_9PEZI|nr:NAD/NADP octopine/nopaline dehydrogenase [Rhypophila decipiens]
MAPENLTVGLLGFGHANAAMAGYFASKGIPTMVYGLVDGEILITEARSLQDLVRNTRFMILSTRVDAHSFYVDELRKHNSLLGKSMLFVMTGAGFTLTYGRDLNFQYVLECSTAPNTAKLDDSGPAAAVHLKSMKLEFELSWFSNASQDRTSVSFDEFPVPVKQTLNSLFNAKIQARSPLNIAFACVGTGVHLPAALLNIGRLPDEARLLTPLAKANIAKLPTLDSGYFYENGMNTYVNRCQLGLDRERLAIAAACGLKAGPTLLEYLNGFYGTYFKDLREFSSNPYPHNAQKATPKDMGHRYYCEEYISLTLLLAIARLVGEPAVLCTAMLTMLETCSPDPLDKCGRDLRGFTVEDLKFFSGQQTLYT